MLTIYDDVFFPSINLFYIIKIICITYIVCLVIIVIVSVDAFENMLLESEKPINLNNSSKPSHSIPGD